MYTIHLTVDHIQNGFNMGFTEAYELLTKEEAFKKIKETTKYFMPNGYTLHNVFATNICLISNDLANQNYFATMSWKTDYFSYKEYSDYFKENNAY